MEMELELVFRLVALRMGGAGEEEYGARGVPFPPGPKTVAVWARRSEMGGVV